MLLDTRGPLHRWNAGTCEMCGRDLYNAERGEHCPVQTDPVQAPSAALLAALRGAGDYARAGTYRGATLAGALGIAYRVTAGEYPQSRDRSFARQTRRVADALAEVRAALYATELLGELRAAGAASGGRIVPEDGEGSVTTWAVLVRAYGEPEDAARERGQAYADRMGWHHYYAGPGRRFGSDAHVSVSRTRVLVTFSEGLDI